jgi:general secretion pathway protein K
VRDNQRSAADVAIFQRLLASQGLNVELADAAVDWIDADSDLSGPGGAEDPYYLSLRKPYRAANAPMVQVEELYRVRGFDAAAVAKLKPLVTALPGNTMVNVNTAPEAVLRALFPDLSMQVGQLLRDRAMKPLQNKDEVKRWAGGKLDAAIEARVDVRSDYFSVRVQVAQDDVELSSDALLARTPGASPAILWLRPRY